MGPARVGQGPGRHRDSRSRPGHAIRAEPTVRTALNAGWLRALPPNGSVSTHDVANADRVICRWTSTGPKARRTGVLVESVAQTGMGEDP